MPIKVDDIKERAIATYNKFAQEFKEELGRQKAERLEDVKAALKATKERMLKTTDATEEELEHIAAAVEKEFRGTWEKAKGGLRRLEKQAWQRPTHKLMNEARNILKEVSGKVKMAAGEFESGLDKGRSFFTGDMVESGTFACKRCSKEILIPFPANLPECSECGGNVFRRK